MDNLTERALAQAERYRKLTPAERAEMIQRIKRMTAAKPESRKTAGAIQ